MKTIIKNSILFSVFLITFLISCKKDELKEVETLAPAKIYLTNVVDGKISVKADNKNVVIDKAAKKVTVALGINRSGLEDKDGYSVKLAVSNTGLPTGVEPLSGSDYNIIVPGKTGSVTTIDVVSGATSAGFVVEFSKALLDANVGKKIGFNIIISEPSKYGLNESLSKASVIIDVPSFAERQLDVTSKYLKNPGAPFQRADKTATSRFGILEDWISNDAVKNIDNRTKGGFDSYNSGGYMAMERWGTPEIPNGKIYQAVTLPKGKYRFEANFETAIISNQLFLTIAEGAGLPDVANIDNAIAKSSHADPKVPFELAAQKEVSIGVVGNLINDAQAFRIRYVKLYKFESPFDE
jgi:hypothetical protein